MSEQTFDERLHKLFKYVEEDGEFKGYEFNGTLYPGLLQAVQGVVGGEGVINELISAKFEEGLSLGEAIESVFEEKLTELGL